MMRNVADLLIGREQELSALRSRWQRAQRGEPGVVAVVGEAGIGKSRLADATASMAVEDGGRTFWARAQEDGGARPYGLWRQILRDHAEAFAVAPSADGDDRDQLFDAITAAVAGLAEPAGAVVVLDDLQWADAGSQVVLRHLIDAMAGSRLLVVLTARPSRQIGDLLAEIARDPRAERLDLAPFDEAETARCLRTATAAAVTDDVVARVWSATGGNPFFVQEIARAGVAHGTGVPPTVRDAVGVRVGRLSPETQALLRTAAVVGEEFSVPVVAALVDRPAAQCLELLDEAREIGLVAPGSLGGTLRFTHALARSAIEDALPTSVRVGLHRAAAVAIEAVYADDLQPHLGELASHWREVAVTGEVRPAFAWTCRAADAAMEELAFEEAAHRYRSALAIGSRALGPDDVFAAQVGLAMAAGRTLDLTTATAACDAAMHAARQAREGAGRLLAQAALALVCVGDRAWDSAIRRRCEEAVAAPMDDPAVRARLLARLTEAALYEGDLDRATKASAEAVALADAVDEPAVTVAALRARQLACTGPEHSDERATVAARMIDLGVTERNPDTEMWGRLWMLDVHFEHGRLPAHRTELSRLRTCAAQVGGVMPRWHVLVAEAAQAQATAHFDDAIAACSEAFQLLIARSHPAAFGAFMSAVAAIRHHVGFAGVPLPFDTTRPPPELAPDAGEVRAEYFVHLGPAYDLAELGRLDEARAMAAIPGDVRSWLPQPYFHVAVFALGARVFGLVGQHAELAICRRHLEPFRGRWVTTGGGSGSTFGPVELTLGRAAGQLGELDAALADLQSALAAARGVGASGFVVEAQCELAAIHLRRGDPTAARDLAETAHASAVELGMVPWSAHASATLASAAAEAAAAAGTATATGTSTTVADGPLSPREVDVARLVADGLTNREIAARLFVSERTAANHVQHILVKLGYSNRTQIAAWVLGGNE